MDWFKVKRVVMRNPEDLIYEHIKKQKAIILPKKL